jgi:DNA-binding NarL/FixJ family response regulator
LLVDDNLFNRKGISRYLKRKQFLVLEAGDEATAWQLATTQFPAMAVIDISIPASANEPSRVQNNFGIRLAKRLKTTYPAMGVVLFSAYEDRGSEVFDLIRAGARGLAYKLKGCRPAALLSAMQAVLAGQVVIDPEVQTDSRVLLAEVKTHLTPEELNWIEEVLDRLGTLTPREKEVADLLAAAHNNEGIAQALNITVKTAESHISHMYEKLGLSQMSIQAPQLRPVIILAKACLIRDLQSQEVM